LDSPKWLVRWVTVFSVMCGDGYKVTNTTPGRQREAMKRRKRGVKCSRSRTERKIAA
jgi:hypothetical protein